MAGVLNLEFHKYAAQSSKKVGLMYLRDGKWFIST